MSGAIFSFSTSKWKQKPFESAPHKKENKVDERSRANKYYGDLDIYERGGYFPTYNYPIIGVNKQCWLRHTPKQQREKGEASHGAGTQTHPPQPLYLAPSVTRVWNGPSTSSRPSDRPTALPGHSGESPTTCFLLLGPPAVSSYKDND